MGPDPCSATISGRRRTIAVLIDHLDHLADGYEAELRNAFSATCRKYGYGLLIAVGGVLDDADPFERGLNSVYHLLGPETVDGVVMVSGSLSTSSGVQGLERLLARYQGLALCSLSIRVPGMPSILVDNETGFDAVIDHLVTVHGRRRIAYLSGSENNVDAIARTKVYEAVLERHGLPLDPRLTACGSFDATTAMEAMQELLGRGVDFDALVAANDGMALAALRSLRVAGIRVPDDVAVVGFDDLVLSRTASPPITTVRQPLRQMAVAAIELVDAKLAGRPVPEITQLDAMPVYRESCGCTSANAISAPPPAAPSDSVADLREPSNQAARALGVSIPLELSETDVAQRLVRDVLEGLDHESGKTSQVLADLVERLRQHSDPSGTLLIATNLLHRRLRDEPGSAKSGLWAKAAQAIATASIREHARRQVDTELTYIHLLRSGTQLSSALDLQALRRALEEALSGMGIENAFVGLYDAQSPEWIVPFVSVCNGRLVDGEVPAFSKNFMLPRAMLARDPPIHAFVFPLMSAERNVGIAAFDLGVQCTALEMLRDQISGALRTVELHEELVRQAAQSERSIQERIATADRMKSLSLLASGVAHDLNNALGPLVALPDVILNDLSAILPQGGERQQWRDDLATIRSASLRAAETIKDLMTLGRHGRTRHDAIDLNSAVDNAVQAVVRQFATSGQQPSQLQVDLFSEPVIMQGSELHVERAIANLVRNAIEAVGGTGQVRVGTSLRCLTNAEEGLETVPPGQYAVLTVSDTGPGVSDKERSRIFEPFFTTKRLRDSSGSGLGLSIVHGVVKEHGGYLDLDSAPGAGARFTLFFPHRPAVPNGRRPDSRRPITRARILVVDDEQIQLRTAARVLRQLGHEVTTLASGSEALALFEDLREKSGLDPKWDASTGPFDLVLMDLELHEEKNGLEVFERIFELFPEQRAILATGHGTMGVDGPQRPHDMIWLSKPYSAQALGRAVSRVLANLSPSAAASKVG